LEKELFVNLKNTNCYCYFKACFNVLSSTFCTEFLPQPSNEVGRLRKALLAFGAVITAC